MAPDTRNARTAGREAGSAMVTATKNGTAGRGRAKNLVLPSQGEERPAIREREQAPDLVGIFAAVKQELGEHLEHFDQDAHGFAKRYTLWQAGPKSYPPKPPSSLHPLLAELIRETVRDQALAVRLYGRPR